MKNLTNRKMENCEHHILEQLNAFGYRVEILE
jgi:hypothetical protein